MIGKNPRFHINNVDVMWSHVDVMWNIVEECVLKILCCYIH